MTSAIPTLPTGARRLVCRAIPAAVAGAAVMIQTAPAVYAKPESTIESECKSAGGNYDTWIGSDGNRYSECCYKDIKGHTYCDYYTNGNYTQSSNRQEGTGPTQPTLQPAPGVPPPATVAPVMPGQGPQPVQPPPATVVPVIP